MADILKEAAKRKSYILLIGVPGTGKTSVLREMANKLVTLWSVMIINTSTNEIAGNGDVPHLAIGQARRMQVQHPNEQHKMMIEAHA